jgi:hypothetical protein
MTSIGSGSVAAFWPCDYGRRSTARNATACGSLRAHGSHGFRNPSPARVGRKTAPPDLCVPAALMPAGISSARRQNTRRSPPLAERQSMSAPAISSVPGILQRLDPTTPVDRKRLPQRHPRCAVHHQGARTRCPATRHRRARRHGVEVNGGQRRSLAGREAKLQTTAVYVLDGKPPTTKRQRPSTIAHPIVTNDQRSALTDAQRANCITQMPLAAITPAKVAKTVGRPRNRYRCRQRADSPTAMAR